MQARGNLWAVVICLTSLWLLASCDTLVVHRRSFPGPGVGYGPPAHARAHGYRHKYVYGYELVYDADCGVYVVVGLTDCYYHEGCFYRLHGGVWEVSLRADTWRPAGHDRLPPGLRVKARPLAAPAGRSHVKLNGKGNSLIKLNGNSGGNGKGKSVAKGRK